MKVAGITGLLSVCALFGSTVAAVPAKRASCSPNGSLVCNGPELFGLCNFGSVTFQSVAAGTQCVDGTIQAAGEELVKKSSCSPNGAVICNGKHLFGLCNFGSVTFQSVAAGTVCVDGTIRAASGEKALVKSSSCSPNGALICNGPDLQGLCNFGSVIFQSVAAGTKCENGAIVTA